MWTRDVMTAALVAGDVADDACQVRGPLGGVFGDLFPLGNLEERAKRILNGLDGILGPRALPPRGTDEVRTSPAREIT